MGKRKILRSSTNSYEDRMTNEPDGRHFMIYATAFRTFGNIINIWQALKKEQNICRTLAITLSVVITKVRVQSAEIHVVS